MKLLLYKDLLEEFKYYEKIKDLIDEYLVYSCLNVAKEAEFPTDYEDVKDHLFGSDDYLRIFLVDDRKKIPQIKGFLIAALENGYQDNCILHCHGIILHPEVQSSGYSKKMIEKAIRLTNPDVVSAKTHNPRCFNAFANLEGVIAYYPNEEDKMPEDIVSLAHSNPFIAEVDEQLIYHEAYPDEKIQQSHRNQKLQSIFNRIGKKDAQAIVAVLNDEKLDLKPKVYTYRGVRNYE